MTLEMGKPLAEARSEIAMPQSFSVTSRRRPFGVDGGYQTAPAGGSRFLVDPPPVGPVC
jgi:succinate-semialdehyde dehydrogenase/glutarate-semialdehyde dehydrogenase